MVFLGLFFEQVMTVTGISGFSSHTWTSEIISLFQSLYPARSMYLMRRNWLGDVEALLCIWHAHVDVEVPT